MYTKRYAHYVSHDDLVEARSKRAVNLECVRPAGQAGVRSEV